ncbi:MAG: hypothetical protein AAGF32_03130 [Pseudomonadota bacterium]
MAVLQVLQTVSALCKDGLAVFDGLATRAQCRRVRLAHLCEQIADSLWRLQEALELAQTITDDPQPVCLAAPRIALLESRAPPLPLAVHRCIAREEGRLAGYADLLIAALRVDLGAARAEALHRRVTAALDQAATRSPTGLRSTTSLAAPQGPHQVKALRAAHLRLAHDEGYFRAFADRLRL